MDRKSGYIALGATFCLTLAAVSYGDVSFSKSTKPTPSPRVEAKDTDGAVLRHQAQESLQRDQPVEAFKVLQPLVAHDDPDALFVVGFLHDLGAGADWDGKKALGLIERAAAKKHVAAQRYLAWKYQSGFNVKKDPAESERISKEIAPSSRVTTLLPETWLSFSNGTVEPNIRRALLWMQTAATDHDPIGQGNLADVYLKSEILPANLESHVFWLMKAADGGNPRSAFKLSRYYGSGILVPEDKAKAMTYLKVSANGGWPEAERALAQAYESGDRVARDEAQAKRWCEKAARQGDAYAMVQLGRLVLNANPSSGDAREALQWFEEAAKQDSASANEQLGYAYLRGQFVKRDVFKCIQYYETAAKLGSAWAKSQLGRVYLYEFGDAPDFNRAQYWLNQAVEAGSPDAMAELGYCYDVGRGTAQSDLKAFELYEKAARLGNGYAQVRMADFLIGGRGTEVDLEEAYDWAKLALKTDEPRAHFLHGYFLLNGLVVPRDSLAAAREYAEGLRKLRFEIMQYNFLRAVAGAPVESRPQLSELLNEILSADPAAADDAREEAAIRVLGARGQWAYDLERFRQRLQKHIELNHAWAARMAVEHELFEETREKKFDDLPKDLGSAGTAEDSDRDLTAAELKFFRSGDFDQDQAAIGELKRLSTRGVAGADFLLGVISCAAIEKMPRSDAQKYFERARAEGSYYAERLSGGGADAVKRLISFFSVGSTLSPAPSEEKLGERRAQLTSTADSPPRLLWQQKPAYPLRQRLIGHDGQVTLQFRVDETGHVVEPDVIKSSHPDFEDAALNSVQTWVFAPATKSGAAISKVVQIPMIFSLKEASNDLDLSDQPSQATLKP